MNNKATMHLAVKYRYITELIHKGFLVLYYEKGKIILADIGTKALPYVDHRRLATEILDFNNTYTTEIALR